MPRRFFAMGVQTKSGSEPGRAAAKPGPDGEGDGKRRMPAMRAGKNPVRSF